MNIINRRSFLERCIASGAGLGVAAMYNVPPFIKRAMAAGGIGMNGKKVLFIFLRGANDGLNALAPVGDPSYYLARTPVGTTPDTGDNAQSLALRKDPSNAGVYSSINANKIGSNLTTLPSGMSFNSSTGGLESGGNTPGVSPMGSPGTGAGTYDYGFGIPTNDGFTALHPSHKFLLPVYNNGDLALIDRVGYPSQSRSHFDSQNYWENGLPRNNLKREGIFYRAMFASGLANTQALTGVSFQGALPLILQGDGAAMTNLSDPTRYDLMGIPNDASGDGKMNRALSNANSYPFSDKDYRELVKLQYRNLTDTLQLFSQISFADANNKFFDSTTSSTANVHGPTDGDVDFYTGTWTRGTDVKPAGQGYWLFPHNNNTDGGWVRPFGGATGTTDGSKYVLLTNGGADYNFMRNLKSAAMVLNYTSAICACTEIGGFDTHQDQMGATHLAGAHARLQRHIAWAMYALYKYFTLYGAGGPKVNDPNLPTLPSPQVSWNDVVVITLSEFGRTTVQNSTRGTDHAEAGLMWVAGGNVKGYNPLRTSNSGSGIYASHWQSSRSTYNGIDVRWVRLGDSRPQGGTASYVQGAATGTGTLFDDSQRRYLLRAVDFRSVLGEIIREHLGASDTQLQYIIPGYASEGTEHLKLGGTVNTPLDYIPTVIAGEVDVI